MIEPTDGFLQYFGSLMIGIKLLQLFFLCSEESHRITIGYAENNHFWARYFCVPLLFSNHFKNPSDCQLHFDAIVLLREHHKNLW